MRRFVSVPQLPSVFLYDRFVPSTDQESVGGVSVKGDNDFLAYKAINYFLSLPKGEYPPLLKS